MAAAVILAGGRSSRMGRDKLTLRLGGTETLLGSALKRFRGYFDEVLVSVSGLTKYPELGDIRIPDIHIDCGPISGLHAALCSVADEGVFLVAADMPFSNPLAALRIVGLCGDCDISVLIDGQGRYEPLFAYYKKSVLSAAEKLLSDGRYKMAELYDICNVKKLTANDLGDLWDDKMLININRIEDYNKCKELLGTSMME